MMNERDQQIEEIRERVGRDDVRLEDALVLLDEIDRLKEDRITEWATLFKGVHRVRHSSEESARDYVGKVGLPEAEAVHRQVGPWRNDAGEIR